EAVFRDADAGGRAGADGGLHEAGRGAAPRAGQPAAVAEEGAVTLARAASTIAVLVLVACAGPPSTAPTPPPVLNILFPIVTDWVRFTSGWGDDRDDGARKHTGQDIFCAKWTPVIAVVSGTVQGILTSPPKAPKGYHVLLYGDDGNVY